MPPVNVLLSGLPYGPSTLCLPVGDERSELRASLIADAVVAATGLPRASFFLRSHGALLHPDAPVTAPGQHTAFVALCLRRALPGGKGGFGAMLRGAAASKKTTNFDACRDLHGRRIRHVRDEIALRDFLQHRNTPDARPHHRDAPSPRKRSRDCRELAAAGRDELDTDELEDDMQRIARGVEDAVAHAVAAGASRRKRPRPAASASASTSPVEEVPPCDWMVDYDDVSSLESDGTRSEDDTDAFAVAQGKVPLSTPPSTPVVTQR